ncbi:hypothetical protein AURDEDRAFT_167021 [Auricularia subglabra TFB-10046 SS5]|nr:hypothetical protein AURDEDRAFT_167021 [Auricularia subglabra TFB-10046 SS5]
MGFCDTPRDISVWVCGRLHAADIARLLDALMRGTGALVAFKLGVSQQELVLRDTAGRMRTLLLEESGVRIDIRETWHGLATRNALCTSLKIIQLPTYHWDEFAEALADCPLQQTEGVQIHIVLNREPVVGDRLHEILRRMPSGVRAMFSGPAQPVVVTGVRPRDWRTLFIDGLDNFELICGYDVPSELSKIVPYILQRLRPSHTRTIRVVVKGAGRELHGNKLQRSHESVRNRVALDVSGNWHVSFE